jgi:transcriptional regulator with XRE-family HTH domain
VLEINSIREKRLKNKWSQCYLAQISGVPQSTISQIESGLRPYPRFESMKKLAEALEIQLEDILLPSRKQIK